MSNNIFESKFANTTGSYHKRDIYPYLEKYNSQFGYRKSLQIVLATGNSIKINRYKDFLDHYSAKRRFNYDLYLLQNLNAPEIYYHYHENSRIKNDAAYYYINEGTANIPIPDFGDYFIITDDSGLEIPALDGWPGVKTKRAAQGYVPKDNSKCSKDMSSAEVILDNISSLPKSDQVGIIHCACCISLVNRDKRLFEPILNGRYVSTNDCSQNVIIGVPENFNERPMTTYDICSPYIYLGKDESSPMISKNTYSMMSNAESMLFGDYTYSAFVLSMNNVLDEYISKLISIHEYYHL